MGATTYHESTYPTEWPDGATRTMEVATYNNRIEIRIGAAGNEQARNDRTSVVLTKTQVEALINDLQRAAGYVFPD